jgi:hypothetical protein
MLDRPSLPISEIVQIAANSALARVSWDGGRGRAPLGYIKGMAVMFAVALRKLAQGDPAAVEMAGASSGDPSRDTLAYYASEFARLGMRNDVSGIDTLRHLFVLMIGLGMRESSGRYCEGRDQSASNTSADTAEAGLFQMSWDARRQPLPGRSASIRPTAAAIAKSSRRCHAAPRRSRQLWIRGGVSAVRDCRFCSGDRGRRVRNAPRRPSTGASEA